MALSELKLTALPTRRPYGCDEIKVVWRYMGGAHKSVAGLFDALNVLRKLEQETKNRDGRGPLSADQQDLLRAALVFTSGGLDACLTRLLRDTLTPLIAGNTEAERNFKRWVSAHLDDRVASNMRQAILAADPRDRMVGLYVTALSTPSLQGTGDLIKVRDALGIAADQLPDERIEQLNPFFAARNEIVHELDLVDPAGPGKSTRRLRGMEAVRDQCDEVFQLVLEIIKVTATNVRSCRSATNDGAS